MACSRCLDDQDVVCPDDGSGTDLTLAGDRILDGKLELERRLGEGGMGAVYQARHLTLGRWFAVKLIRRRATDVGYAARFRTEAAALGRLKHPGIVDVSDFGLDPRNGGTPYLVMELLEGVSLEAHCADSGPMSLEATVPILAGIADAVDFAHRAGVLHRDLKPSNVFLVRHADGPRVKLVDFGLARLNVSAGESVAGAGPQGNGDAARLEEPTVAARPRDPRPEEGQGRLETLTERGAIGASAIETTPISSSHEGWLQPGETRPGDLVGTPTYMAPERFAGVASTASDVYALGVIAYYMLTGRTPFSGSLSAIVRGHTSEPPAAPSLKGASIPPAVDGAILKALSKQPRDRPLTAAALAGEIAGAARAREARAWRERELPRRLATAAAIALTTAAVAPRVSALAPVQALERAALDARLGSAPARAADPRLLVILLDDASLAGETRPLTEMAEPVATALQRVFAAGARAVAIDLLLPESWARTPAFAELAIAQHGRLTLAAHAAPGGLVGFEALSGLPRVALGERTADDSFGLVNLDEDPDGVVRRGRLGFSTDDGGRIRSWAAAAARTLDVDPAPPEPSTGLSTAPPGSFLLDSRDVPPESVIAWSDLSGLLSAQPSRFDGKLVLLGARLAGSGDEAFRVAPGGAAPSSLPGVLVQSRAIDTILAGFPIRELAGPGPLLLTAALAGGVAAALLLGWRLAPATVVILLASHPLVALIVHALGRTVVPVAAPMILVLAAAAAALALRLLLPAPPWKKGNSW